MGPKAWMYRNSDGTYNVEEYKRDKAEFEQLGGGAAALEKRYQLRQYGKEKEAAEELWAGTQNEMISGGQVPGTRAWQIAEDYMREEVFDPLYERYEQYFSDGPGEPPFKASPAERVEYWREQNAKELASVYYDIMAEDYADEDGNIDWDAFQAARDAALDALGPDDRQDVERYLRRNRIPEEEAMEVVEDAVYGAIMDLIAQKADADEATKTLLDEEIARLQASQEETAVAALANAAQEIMGYHIQWGEDELARFLGFDPPGFDAWTRQNDTPREAFESAFKSFYWSIPDEVRRVTWDEEWATRAGVPDSYMGDEFAEWRAENKRLEGLDEVSDEQLLDWMAQAGVLAELGVEGFVIPGQELPESVSWIPGYEQRLENLEYEPEWDVTGRAGSTIPGRPGSERLEVGEARAAMPRTEQVRSEMEAAIAASGVAGEENKGQDVSDPLFALPEPEMREEMAQAYAEMDAWVAAGKEGDWTPLMEKWFGNPDSPSSKWWEAYAQWRAPEEGNPLGWGLLPRELKDNPFIKQVLEAVGEDRTVDDEVYISAREVLEEYVAEHGEELTQARDEMVQYLALLDPELEELQDEYYDLPEDQRRAYRDAHPELLDYWKLKREFKDEHPLLVQYYFPDQGGTTEYQPRYYGGGGYRGGGRRRGRAAQAGGSWSAFSSRAGRAVVSELIDYWGGRGPLSQEAIQYLQALFRENSYGAANFEDFLDVLRSMWQGSIQGGEYDIPMRQSATMVSPYRTSESSRSYWPSPPTRVRMLRS